MLSRQSGRCNVFRVHAGAVDYTIIAVYFAVVLGIGFVARRQVHTGLDFFLSGRTLGKGEGLAGQAGSELLGGWAELAGVVLDRAGRSGGQGCLGGGAVAYESPQYQQLFGCTAEDPRNRTSGRR